LLGAFYEQFLIPLAVKEFSAFVEQCSRQFSGTAYFCPSESSVYPCKYVSCALFNMGLCSPDSIVTRYELISPGVESWCKRIPPPTSRPALGPSDLL